MAERKGPTTRGAREETFQPQGEGLRQIAYQVVGEFRNAHQGAGMQLNGNLEACAQYLADRLQSGSGAGVIPPENRGIAELTKLFWYTGETVGQVLVTPWDSGTNHLNEAFAQGGNKEVVLDEWQEVGVGIGGGPMNLWVVYLFGKRANMVKEPRTAAKRRVPLNERFDCTGPALATEDTPTTETMV